MLNLSTQLALLAARIDALSIRERILVLTAILSVLVAGWNATLNEGYQKERAQLVQTLSLASTRMEALNSTMAEILARAQADPNQEARARLQGLQNRLAELNAQKRDLAASFISTHAMVTLLDNLLQSRGSLRLVALEKLAPQPLLKLETAAGKPVEPADDIRSMIYRHDLVVDFEGGYFDMLGYLRELEKLPLFWDSIDYEVASYPQARVRLRVYTLSFEKEWLGV